MIGWKKSIAGSVLAGLTACGVPLGNFEPFVADLFITEWFSAEEIWHYRSRFNSDPIALLAGEDVPIGLRAASGLRDVAAPSLLGCDAFRVVSTQDFVLAGGADPLRQSFRDWAEKAVVVSDVSTTLIGNLSRADLAIAAMLPASHRDIFNRSLGAIEEDALTRVLSMYQYGYRGLFEHQIADKEIRMTSRTECEGFTIFFVEVR